MLSSKTYSPVIVSLPSHIVDQPVQIIHNPGQIPDPRYLLHCDLTVVFEGTYSTFQIYGF